VTYDEEAIFQDADIEMAEYAREARRDASLRNLGVCLHSSVVGSGNGSGPLPGGLYYAEQEGLTGTQVRCTDTCGEVFDSDEAWDDATREARF